MALRYSPLLLLLAACIFLACTNTEKEDNLRRREAALQQKEAQFAAKLQDYDALKAMRDSLDQLPQDSTVVVQFPAEILGKYNGKMVCTESDCAEHAIGDVRNDVWEILPEAVRITNKSGGNKVYTGKITDGELKLRNEDTPGTVSEITLPLPATVGNRLKGSREVKRENCVSKFSVELEKNKD